VRSALRSPRLRRIIAAYTVNRLGTWFGLVALAIAVFDHTHSAVAVAALLFAWQALPAFLVPIVVARVEASSVRRSELSGLYFFEAVTTAALAVLLWHFWLPAVLLLAALDGTAALAASALLRTEVARTGRDQVEPRTGDAGGADASFETDAQEAESKANAALNFAFSAAFVAGPVLGGVVVAALGPPAALFVDVGSFLIGGVLLLDLRRRVEEIAEGSVRGRLQAAWAHINEAPSLRGLLLAQALALVFIEAGGPIEVAYVKATLHGGDRGYGLLVTSWGAGAIIGSLIFARFVHRPLGAMLKAGTFALGAAFVGFALAPSLALACMAALIGGIGNGVEWPSLISLVQRLTPQRLHGRLMGAVESLAALCLAIGLSLGGALVALGSPRLAFLVIGLGAMVTTVAMSRLSLTRFAVESDSDTPAAASTASPSASNEESLPCGALPHEPAPM
jgi:hypothetical protein